jgi:peptidoglycan/xylan/chitin deacetylase (PgdA/CDA1 family)
MNRRRAFAAAAACCLAAAAVAAGAEQDTTPARHQTARRGTLPPLPRVRDMGRERLADHRAIARALAVTPFIHRGAPRRKEVALTFDDGPGPDTPRIVRWLRAHHVRATFFLVGRFVIQHPALVREEARAGDSLGDHTQDHAALPRLGAAAQAREIDAPAALITRLTGRAVRLFRPPYGSYDATTLALLRQRRMLMVLWSVDTRDYLRPGVRRIAYTALSGARAGTIVLMHDGGGPRGQTLGAVRRIVHKLRTKGYRFVTVPQLLSASPARALSGR